MCPWNEKFATALPDESPFSPRPALRTADGGVKDVRTLARELLAISQSEFSTAFKGSPMKRAKLRGLRRNAAVVLGSAGSLENVPALAAVLSDDEPTVRSHAAWALERLVYPADAAGPA